MSEPASEVVPTAPGGPETGDDEIGRSFGLRPEAVRLLREAGYTSPEAVQRLEDAQLTELGLTTGDVARIRNGASAGSEAAAAAPASGGNRVMERWMDQARRAERPRRRSVGTSSPKDSAAVLKKWVDGDDRAMETWIQSADAARPTSPLPAASSSGSASEAGPMPASPGSEAGGIAPSTPASGPATAHLLAREETVVRWLTDLLDRVKSNEFDPASVLQEVQELNRNLFEEQAKRKQLEEELEHVKRGSIAVIKYVRSREAKARDQALQAKDAEIAELRLRLLTGARGAGEQELAATSEGSPDAPQDGATANAAPSFAAAERKLREEFRVRETQYQDRETELRRRIVQLEGEARNLRTEAGAITQREERNRQDAPKTNENLSKMITEAEARERELTLRENELRTRFEEIRIATEDMERKRSPLAMKERELEVWEQQLSETRQALELETRQFEQRRSEEGEPAPRVSPDELRKIEAIKIEILNKEAEMKARETYIRQKIEELERLQKQGTEMEPERPNSAEAAATKIRSGIRRLDDLLFGGFPPASQLLLNGPAHSGKEILARLFMAEGLKQGVPALWIATDKTYTQIRDEMTQLLPAYPELEQKGMVKYVDLYSRSLGVTQSEPGVRLLSATDKGVLDQLNQAVNNATAEFKDRYRGYRVVMESVSTLTAFLDTAALFRFLQPFSGRRKLDGATGYYLLETGMHTESDLQTLEHMMDGSINLKVEQLKTFLSVKGISEVQSRAWIGYTFSKKAFSLGSFSLDHIR